MKQLLIEVRGRFCALTHILNSHAEMPVVILTLAVVHFIHSRCLSEPTLLLAVGILRQKPVLVSSAGEQSAFVFDNP